MQRRKQDCGELLVAVHALVLLLGQTIPRHKRIINDYVPMRMHPRLFDTERGWEPEWFDPAFLAAAESGSWRPLLREETWEVYSFPMFSDAFCEMLIAEMDNYEQSGLPVERPNSMNNYGLIINMIGLEPMMDLLQRQFLQPLCHEMFPVIGSQFDQHHSFIVQYKVGADLGLDMHTDDSEVTFNICLGREFDGAGLQVCGNQATAEHRKGSLLYRHVKGRCLVHLGHRRHGADDITQGERLNLIIWNKNNEYRRSSTWRRFHVQSNAYSKEDCAPDPVCVSYTHDRDYAAFKAETERTRKYRHRRWCPPVFAQYEDFTEGMEDHAPDASCSDSTGTSEH